MQLHGTHLLGVIAIALVAIMLGVAVLDVGGLRSTTGAAVAAPAPAPATLVADSGSPAPAPAPAPPDPGGPAGTPAPQPEATAAPPAVDDRRRGGVSCAQPHRIAQLRSDAVVFDTPGGTPIGRVPATSAYLRQPVIAWVQDTKGDGGWGRVTIPWTKPVTRSGWIRLDGHPTGDTTTLVVADLSERNVTVYDRCRAVLRVRSAIGRPGSPSPSGRFWVTDRVIVPSAQRGSFGSFAFGLSTVQPNLPDGWTGGDQMAIHGTGAPGSIGQAASAGCLRVTEDALARLKPLLRIGTPVVIQA
jgi:lipoprotein-anchoring transpeptidase ErfK/SrfK